jgi:hypothetical protein
MDDLTDDEYNEICITVLDALNDNWLEDDRLPGALLKLAGAQIAALRNRPNIDELGEKFKAFAKKSVALIDGEKHGSVH